MPTRLLDQASLFPGQTLVLSYLSNAVSRRCDRYVRIASGQRR